MQTLDAVIEADLITLEHGFTVVYEIADVPTAGSTVRFGSRDITWNGNSYTGLALKTSRYKESMKPTVPEIGIKATNIANTFRGWLEPVDLLTGKRLTQRLLVLDANGDAKAQSHILSVTEIKRPERVSEKEFEFKGLGLIDGHGIKLPQRRTSLWCPARYGDGVDCNYTITTTTSAGDGGGPNLFVPVTSGTKLALSIGEEVIVGSNDPVGIVDVVGNVMEVDEAIEFSAAENVSLKDCNREFAQCEIRDREHEFLGFLGVDAIARSRFIANSLAIASRRQGFSGRRLSRLFGGGEPGEPPDLARDFANPRTFVPIVFGRILTAGLLIETTVAKWPGEAATAKGKLIEYRALSEGECFGPVGYFVDEEIGVDQFDGGGMTLGLYFRPGAIGVDAEESAYAATELPQKRDALSFVKSPYSRTCYAMTVQKDTDQVATFLIDFKGIEIQKYTVGGAPDGAKVWSQTGPWIVLDILLAPRYGYGKRITTADISPASWFNSAATCDAVIASTEANTTIETASGGASTTYLVKDALGFIRGMNCKLGAASAGEIVQIPDRKTIVTDTALDSSVDDVFQAQVPRFTTNGKLDSPEDGREQLEDILDSFGGFLTYDQGLIECKVEKQESAVAHFKDIGAAAGYGILEGSFKWLTDDPDMEVNRVAMTFNNSSTDLGDDEVAVTDWDHVFANQLREKTISNKWINTRDQAFRRARLRLDKIRNPETRCQIDVQPIGIKYQPGDVIQVTHAVPGWSGVKKRIASREIIGLGRDEELCVRYKLEAYRDADHTDVGHPPPTVATQGSPSITLNADVAQDHQVRLDWTTSNINKTIHFYRVYKSDTSPVVRSPLTSLGITTQQEFLYTPLPAEIGTSLYFVVVAVTGPLEKIVSNELEVSPGGTTIDPVSMETVPGVNLVAGGDFDDDDGWEHANDPTWTDYRPQADAYDSVNYPDGTFTNPSYARDVLGLDTYAYATVSSRDSYERNYYYTTDVSGWTFFKVWLSAVGPGRTEIYTSVDNGTSYQLARTLHSTGSLNAPVEVTLPFISNQTGRTHVRVRFVAISTSNVISYKCRVWDIKLRHGGSTQDSWVSGGQLHLYGGGTGNYAEASRPFPGIIGGHTIWDTSFKACVGIQAKMITDFDPGDSLTVELEMGGNYTELIEITSTLMFSAGYKLYVKRFIPSVALDGIYRITVRSDINDPVIVDRLMLNETELIRAFNHHVDEHDKVLTYRDGRPGALSPTGPWTAAMIRSATIS